MGLGIVKLSFRGLELLWTLLLTALIGNVIATNIDSPGLATAAVNFTMFIAIISWIACIYGIVAFFVESLARPVAMIFFDGLVVLFAFIDAIVLAAKLRVTSCGNIDPDKLPGDWIGWGSANDEKRCRELQASTVFMWFLLVCFSVNLFFNIREARQNFGNSYLSSRPPMSYIGV